MPINNYWEFVCDNCKTPIFYHPTGDRQTAIHKAKEDGIIVKGGKIILCDKKCLKEWRKKND